VLALGADHHPRTEKETATPRALPAFALGLVIAIPAVAAAFAVDTTMDGHDAALDGMCDMGNGMCSLRAAVEEASALGGAQTISLPAGTYMLSVTGACDGVALCVTGTPKKLDPTLRGSLLDDGRPIQANVKSLRDSVSCPGDAPPQ